MIKKRNKIINLLYLAVLVVLTFMFFTNDFGLVDIRKTSVIVGLGIDMEEDDIKLTAQVSLPQPSENGENTKYANVSGSGKTVGEAVKEINTKTGFYPKLVFCELIVLGESCQKQDIFGLLDYFYRNTYSQLTPVVAMCKGSAGDLLGVQLPFAQSATDSVVRLLSEEAKKSGNVSTVNLKTIGMQQYSPSQSCYMPYIESKEEGGSGGESGGGSSSGGSSSGESGGGQSGGQSSGTGGSSGGQSGSGGGSQGGSGGGGEQSGGESGKSEANEFMCNKTAVFDDGKFKYVLDEEQAFGFNLLRNKVRHTFVRCQADGKNYTLGLRSCSGDMSLKMEDGVPVVTLSFKAVAKIQDSDEQSPPSEAGEGKVPDKVLGAASTELISYFDGLVGTIKQSDCDVLGLKITLYRKKYKDYEKFKDSLLREMKVEYDVKLQSAA